MVFSKAASLPYSDKVETKVAIKIATAIPTDSNQSALRSIITILTPKASKSILMIGSPKLLRN